MTTRRLTVAQTVTGLVSVILAALACVITIVYREIRLMIGLEKDVTPTAQIIYITATPDLATSRSIVQVENEVTPELVSTPKPNVTVIIVTASPETVSPETAPPVVEPTVLPPAATPSPGVTNRRVSLGSSGRGNSIYATQIGYPSGSGSAIVVVGHIAGEQSDTSEVVTDISLHYETDPGNVPDQALLYFIENINPDSSDNKRFNANGVDLNRNWATFNWTSNPPVAGASAAGAGGSKPFSEPETRALRDLVLLLQASGRKVIVVVLHSSARAGRHDVFPGYTQAGIHRESGQQAQAAAGILGFNYSSSSSDPTTGELIGWCAEQDIPSIDIFWSRQDGNQPSAQRMAEVINALSQ